MTKGLLSVTLLVLGLLCLAAPASAQSNAAPVPRGDVFAGVAFWGQENETLAGFHLSGAWRPAKKFAVVGDVAQYEADYSSLMGGVRFQSTGRHSMYVQVLFGKAPFDDIALQPGLGVDVRISRQAAVRAGFDLMFAGDDGSAYVGMRISVGLAILLGQQ